MRRTTPLLLCCMGSALCCGGAHGAITVFSRDLAGFNAAAGNPPITIDFDDIAPGTDITGWTIEGATLNAPGAPLIVVRAEDTLTPPGVFTGIKDITTNTLPATTPPNILSPGGEMLGAPDPAIQDDDLEIIFAEPVRVFGFDHLSQSADGFSFTSISVFNSAGQILLSSTIPISNLGGAGAPGGADFYGIVSDQADIKRIRIDEGDGNTINPDANIGYDTFRFFPPFILGDMNGDGVFDAFDVAPFELALADRAAYMAMHPGLDADLRGDFNGDGILDAFDVAGFEIALASGGATAPEPLTLAPVIACGLYTLIRRHR